MNEAYYNRVMSDKMVDLLKEGGKFNWLIDYVIKHKDSEGNEDLDFQTTSNRNHKGEVILSKFSIYRGTSSVLSLEVRKGKNVEWKVYADKAYMALDGGHEFYQKSTWEASDVGTMKRRFDEILRVIEDDEDFDSFFKDKKGKKKMEGYYQTLVSRRYSLNCKPVDDLLIFDKEFKLGFVSKHVKDKEFMPKISNWVYDMKSKIAKNFEELEYDICTALNKEKPEEFKKISTKCDFVGINKKGDIVLLELKQRGDGKKIYLSPLQVGTYYKLLSQYIEKEGLPVLQNVIFEMVKQKQRLGIINKDYKLPSKLSGNIKLAVVVGGEAGKQAKEQYETVRQIIEEDIKNHIVDNKITYYTCDENDGTLKDEIIKD